MISTQALRRASLLPSTSFQGFRWGTEEAETSVTLNAGSWIQLAFLSSCGHCWALRTRNVEAEERAGAEGMGGQSR